MSEGEFDSSATKHQEYGVKSLGSLLVGTTAYSQPQLLDGAVLRIWMMTLATDTRSKEVFKKVQAKNSVFYERTFGKRSIWRISPPRREGAKPMHRIFNHFQNLTITTPA